MNKIIFVLSGRVRSPNTAVRGRRQNPPRLRRRPATLNCSGCAVDVLWMRGHVRSDDARRACGRCMPGGRQVDGRCATRAQWAHTCTNVRFGRGLSTAMKRVRRCALESPGLSTPSAPWGTAAEKATCRWPANQYRGFIACRQALVLQGQVRGLVHVGVLSLGECLTGSPPRAVDAWLP